MYYETINFLFLSISKRRPIRRLLHKGESLCCFRDSALVTYGGMLPSDLTLSALRFILSAKSGQSCEQDCETVDSCNSHMRALSNFSFLRRCKVSNSWRFFTRLARSADLFLKLYRVLFTRKKRKDLKNLSSSSMGLAKRALVFWRGPLVRFFIRVQQVASYLLRLQDRYHCPTDPLL